MVSVIHTSTPTLRLIVSSGKDSEELGDLQGTWTTEQYLRLTESINWLIEYTDGDLEVLSMPTKRHQAIIRFLLITAYAFLAPRGGTAYDSPIRLRIREGKFREPDLILALDANDPRLQDAYFLGADIVMEVVSPDDPERDIVTKRADYAEARIPEYWIVNPLDESVIVLRLEGEKYTEHGLFLRGESAISLLLDGFSIYVDDIFDAR